MVTFITLHSVFSFCVYGLNPKVTVLTLVFKVLMLVLQMTPSYQTHWETLHIQSLKLQPETPI